MSASVRQFAKSQTPKTRPSVAYCRERYSCQTANAKAKYYCSDCKSVQCEECRFQLHQDPRYIVHEPEVLLEPHPDLICQAVCKTFNFADISCSNCARNFCFECDHKIHSNKNRSFHIRQPFIFEEEEYISCRDGISLENIDFPEDSLDSEKMMSLRSDVLEALASENNDIQDLPESDSAFLSITQVQSVKKTLGNPPQSFLLIDKEEVLQIPDEQQFIAKLGCKANSPVKVISIFGNTGDGKSYTLNQAFYGGHEVFLTSASQTSCTLGIWAAYDHDLGIITIDTEGFLGETTNENQRQRLLLKILAISDIVIYRTRAPRLRSDLFSFLGTASRIFLEHFSKEMEAAALKHSKLVSSASSLGPSVIVFHETCETDPFKHENGQTPADQLRGKFISMDIKINAFSSLDYIGEKTIAAPTDFDPLSAAVLNQLKISLKSGRPPSAVFRALKTLNDKFSGTIQKVVCNPFLDQYFFCQEKCLSCHATCQEKVHHAQPHASKTMCFKQHQYDNEQMLCRKCLENNQCNTIVKPQPYSTKDGNVLGPINYLSSGYVLECQICGIIYRSREHWFGNKEPWETKAVTKIVVHVWPEAEDLCEPVVLNTAQKVIDQFQYVSSAVSNTLGQKLTDLVAPSYWKPNGEITNCNECSKDFGVERPKHHCRACGEGVCDGCSLNKLVIKEWGKEPTRVCNQCFKKNVIPRDENDISYRKYTEFLTSSLETVGKVLEIPKKAVKDYARPDYWVPDSEITQCCCCEAEFVSMKLLVHHCRSCGKGVCDKCSQTKQPVPLKNYHYDVRVCDKCSPTQPNTHKASP